MLDLDNTLWGGVLGEDGIDGIQLGEGTEGEAFAAFQEHVLALEAKGVVLAICSKNDEPLVRDAFARHPGMRVPLDRIAVLSAGWDDKPAQIRRIAQDLGLGLDSLVFCDDNPVERESVRQLTPEVDVVRLPTDPAGYVRALADYPYFESTRLTEDDLHRTEQYRARAAAAAALGEASSLEDFLDSLDMEATFEPVGRSNLPRVAQLVGKTNQFNLTSRRRSEAELTELVADPATVAFAARLRDRYADHGLVAVVLARADGPDLDVDTWLMSCRVIGRSLEDLVLERLAAEAHERGCVGIRGDLRPHRQERARRRPVPPARVQPERRTGRGRDDDLVRRSRRHRRRTPHPRVRGLVPRPLHPRTRTRPKGLTCSTTNSSRSSATSSATTT